MCMTAQGPGGAFAEEVAGGDPAALGLLAEYLAGHGLVIARAGPPRGAAAAPRPVDLDGPRLPQGRRP
jgi:hypothetical protein